MTARGTAALLAANPNAWQPRPDCRPALRAAILKAAKPPGGGFQVFALWLADRFNADGTLPKQIDRKWLQRRCGLSASTFSRYLRQLERLDLIGRRHYSRSMHRTGEYRHAVEITVAARLRPKPAQAPDLRNGHGDHPTPLKRVTGGLHALSVGSLSGRNARTSDDQSDYQPAPAERDLWARHWPQLAPSRAHVPDCQPSAQRFVRPTCGRCATRHNWHQLCPDQLAALDVPEEPF